MGGFCLVVKFHRAGSATDRGRKKTIYISVFDMQLVNLKCTRYQSKVLCLKLSFLWSPWSVISSFYSHKVRVYRVTTRVTLSYPQHHQAWLLCLCPVFKCPGRPCSPQCVSLVPGPGPWGGGVGVGLL